MIFWPDSLQTDIPTEGSSFFSPLPQKMTFFIRLIFYFLKATVYLGPMSSDIQWHISDVYKRLFQFSLELPSSPINTVVLRPWQILMAGWPNLHFLLYFPSTTSSQGWLYDYVLDNDNDTSKMCCRVSGKVFVLSDTNTIFSSGTSILILSQFPMGWQQLQQSSWDHEGKQPWFC